MLCPWSHTHCLWVVGQFPPTIKMVRSWQSHVDSTKCVSGQKITFKNVHLKGPVTNLPFWRSPTVVEAFLSVVFPVSHTSFVSYRLISTMWPNWNGQIVAKPSAKICFRSKFSLHWTPPPVIRKLHHCGDSYGRSFQAFLPRVPPVSPAPSMSNMGRIISANKKQQQNSQAMMKPSENVFQDVLRVKENFQKFSTHGTLLPWAHSWEILWEEIIQHLLATLFACNTALQAVPLGTMSCGLLLTHWQEENSGVCDSNRWKTIEHDTHMGVV